MEMAGSMPCFRVAGWCRWRTWRWPALRPVSVLQVGVGGEHGDGRLYALFPCCRLVSVENMEMAGSMPCFRVSGWCRWRTWRWPALCSPSSSRSDSALAQSSRSFYASSFSSIVDVMSISNVRYCMYAFCIFMTAH